MITDVESYRLKKKYAIALRRIMTKDAPGKRFVPYLGMEPHQFRSFIERQLRPEFTTSNYGKVWVLDHIVPVFLFDQREEADLAVCWNYINTIPMPLLMNRLKGVSLEFALKELEIRSTWSPNSLVIAELKKRINGFVASLAPYHSKVKLFTNLN